jgi:predicted HAD superfamily Cof-like phosphohydrolase
MKKEIIAVNTFHHASNHPVGNVLKPATLDMGRLLSRTDWMQEEIDELKEATQKKDLPGAVDAIVDLLYFAFGTAVEMGCQNILVEAFDRVHQANMSKFAPTVEEANRTVEEYKKQGISTYWRVKMINHTTNFVIYFSDGEKAGKVAKYVDWKKPDLTDLFPDGSAS